MKTKFDDLYLDVAFRVAQLSSAERLKVGAVVVSGDRIISYGYNGTLPGTDNCCETTEGTTKEEVFHAEEAALGKLACSHESSQGTKLYLTHSPCIRCSKLIIRSGIKSVIYNYSYRDMAGVELLRKANVSVSSYDDLTTKAKYGSETKKDKTLDSCVEI